MMEGKHTPKPWYAVEYAGFVNIQTEPTYGGNNILDMEVCDEVEANADLMAAAPDMYEALELAQSYLLSFRNEWKEGDDMLYHQIVKALIKAKNGLLDGK